MDKTISKDNEIMRLLKTSEVRRIICNTGKGILELMLRKGDVKYFLTLDSVPLDKGTNKELMDLLFKPEVPTVNKEPTHIVHNLEGTTQTSTIKEVEKIIKKKYKYTPKKKVNGKTI